MSETIVPCILAWGYFIAAACFAVYGIFYTSAYGQERFFDKIRLDDWGLGAWIFLMLPLILYTLSTPLWYRGQRSTNSD